MQSFLGVIKTGLTDSIISKIIFITEICQFSVYAILELDISDLSISLFSLCRAFFAVFPLESVKSVHLELFLAVRAFYFLYHIVDKKNVYIKLFNTLKKIKKQK